MYPVISVMGGAAGFAPVPDGLEILGAGMVDPNYIDMLIITPKKLTALLSEWALNGYACLNMELMI